MTLSFVRDTVFNLIFIPQWFACLKKGKKENVKAKSEIDQSYEPVCSYEKEAMLVKAINMDCLQVMQAAQPFGDLGLRFVCSNMETHLHTLLSLLKANTSPVSEQLKHDYHGSHQVKVSLFTAKLSL